MDLEPTKTAFLFPGQGSQAMGMGQDLTFSFPIARAAFAQADEILGTELSHIAWNGPEEVLNDTINTQPALMVHSIAALRVFWEKYPSFAPKFVAGHSMGELTALVAAGALPFPDALILVRRRGELMKEAGEISPGGMAAVLGLDTPTVEGLVDEANVGEGKLQIANDNCPGQVVVSGAGHALRRFMLLAKEAGAAKVIPLAVSIAAHSQLMAHAQAKFNQTVDSADLKDPNIPIIGNVSAAPLRRARDIEDDLKAQLTSRVRWAESIQYMLGQGVDTFVEFGTGAVLSSLVKRIFRKTERISLDTASDFERLF